jgi:hypothetical protein
MADVVVSKNPAIPDKSAPAPKDALKLGTFWMYAWNTGLKDNDGKAVLLPVLALVIDSKQITRPKMNADGSAVMESKTYDTTKGKITRLIAVYEPVTVYSIKLFSGKWSDEKLVSGIEASALTAI